MKHPAYKHHLVVCTGGVPSSGATVVACLLSHTIFADATRIRQDAPGDRLTAINPESLPATCFRSHFRSNAGLASHRARMFARINQSEKGSRFILDVSSGDPSVALPPVAYLFRGDIAPSDYLIDLVLILKPDMNGVQRAKTAVTNLCRQDSDNVRLTTVFNGAPSGYSPERTDWHSMWTQWSYLSLLKAEGRSREIHLPAFSDRLVAEYLTSRAHIAAPGTEISAMDQSRWHRALGQVRQLFSDLETVPANFG